MIAKKGLSCPAAGQKLWAKCYSIVDVQLLHGGYLHKLSPFALALYLFLVVVGDPYGKSFYSETMICSILRFQKNTFDAALKQLIDSHLVEYRNPFFWVKNIPVTST